MSLSEEYRNNLKSRLPMGTPPADADMMGIPPVDKKMLAIDEDTYKVCMDILNKAVSTQSGEVPPIPATADVAGENPPTNAGGDVHESMDEADNIFYEFLSHFKNKIGECQNPSAKIKMRRFYEMMHKLREKALKEMIAEENDKSSF